MNSNLINKAIKWGGLFVGGLGILAASCLRVTDTDESDEMIEGEFTPAEDAVVIEEVKED